MSLFFFVDKDYFLWHWQAPIPGPPSFFLVYKRCSNDFLMEHINVFELLHELEWTMYLKLSYFISWCVVMQLYNPFLIIQNKQESADYCAEESRCIHCTKCGNSHIWVCTNRTKTKARWCQVWALYELVLSFCISLSYYVCTLY